MTNPISNQLATQHEIKARAASAIATRLRKRGQIIRAIRVEREAQQHQIWAGKIRAQGVR